MQLQFNAVKLVAPQVYISEIVNIHRRMYDLASRFRTAELRSQTRLFVPQRRKDLHPFECKSLIHLVRLAGIEPTTPWFVAKYSIQLSYSR